MSDKMLDLVARRFRTLGEPYRLRILQELEAGEKSVGELVAALDGNQPNVSKHLHILSDAGTDRPKAGRNLDLLRHKRPHGLQTMRTGMQQRSREEPPRVQRTRRKARTGEEMKIKQFEAPGLAQYGGMTAWNQRKLPLTTN